LIGFLEDHAHKPEAKKTAPAAAANDLGKKKELAATH
jgi:hypothetical protein